MSSPLCCSFDAVSRTISLASRGSRKADSVCLTLWQLVEGGPPALIGQHGRPAKQGFFTRAQRSYQAWSISLNTAAKACLVADPGSRLHLFQWQAGP